MLQNRVHFPHFRFVVGIEALVIFIGKNPITKLSGKKTYGKRVSSSVLVGNDLLLSHQWPTKLHAVVRWSCEDHPCDRWQLLLAVPPPAFESGRVQCQRSQNLSSRRCAPDTLQKLHALTKHRSGTPEFPILPLSIQKKHTHQKIRFIIFPSLPNRDWQTSPVLPWHKVMFCVTDKPTPVFARIRPKAALMRLDLPAPRSPSTRIRAPCWIKYCMLSLSELRWSETVETNKIKIP